MFAARYIIKAVKDNNLIELKRLIEKHEWSTFYLNNSKMTDDIVGIIIEYIKYNDKIKFVNLCVNLLTDIGIYNVLNAIKINSIPINGLNLACNRITTLGIKHIAESLQTNSTSITELYFSGCKLDITGVKYLSEALKTNTILTTLGIPNNQIRDSGVYNLTEALKHNSTLTRLNLSTNFMTNNGIKSILNCLKYNSTLISIDVYYNDFLEVIDKQLENEIYYHTQRNIDNNKIRNMSLQERCYKIIKDCNIDCPESYKKLYDNTFTRYY